jgi:hypothetical protein
MVAVLTVGIFLGTAYMKTRKTTKDGGSHMTPLQIVCSVRRKRSEGLRLSLNLFYRKEDYAISN